MNKAIISAILLGLTLAPAAHAKKPMAKKPVAAKPAPAAVAPVAAVPAPTPAPVAAKTPLMTTADTDIGTLLDNPASKAVLDKYLPGFSGNPQIAMARPMTLRDIQQFKPDVITNKALSDIDTDLANLGK